MGSLDKLESTLDGVLGSKASLKLPANVSKAIAHALWWLALIVGVLELWGAFSLWDLGHRVDNAVSYVNTLTSYYGGPTSASHLGPFFYVSLLAMALVAVVLLCAVPALKAMKKSGWNLLFYGAIVEAVVSLARLFTDSNIGGGFGNFIGAALGALIGAYFLFQVRSYFIGAKAATAPVKK